MKTNVHATFFVLLARLPHQSKQDMVWQYSNMLTDSLSEFYAKDPEGYSKMIRDMQAMVNSMDNVKNMPKMPGGEEVKKLRSAILHRLQKHGVDTTNWEKVNAFLEQPRIAGKRLYQMSVKEMENLVKKLESILKKDKKRLAEENRMAQMN